MLDHAAADSVLQAMDFVPSPDYSPAMLDASASHPRSVRTDTLGLTPLLGFFLLLLVALAYLPGQAGVPPIDRDEPRYTQATKQMMETGDYVRIRFQDGPRHKKPVGIHWLQAGYAQALGYGAEAPLWVYRLASLTGAIAALALAVWAARAFLPLPLATAAGALFAATIIVGVEARLAKTDAVLLATILAAQGALARLWLAERPGIGLALLFWAALGLGILVKGPIAPMVCGLTIAALAVVRRRRVLAKLRPLVGLPLMLAIALPWYVAIYFATDGAFFAAAVGTDFLGKAVEGQEGHGAPPLTHIAFVLGVGWPLAAFVVASLWHGVRLRTDTMVFAFAWVVPAWIVFELTPTKLPHYTLPLLPGLAIAAVAAISTKTPPRFLRAVAGVMILSAPLVVLAGAPFLLAALAAIGPQSAALLDNFPLALGMGLIALSLAAALFAAVSIWRGADLLARRVVAPTVLAAVIAQATVWGVALPALTPVWLSTRLVAAADALDAGCEAPRLVSVGGFHEPSMIFLSGTDTALVEEAAAIRLAGAECVVIAARSTAVDALKAEAAAHGISLSEGDTVEGFNISKGDPLSLTVFAPSPVLREDVSSR